MNGAKAEFAVLAAPDTCSVGSANRKHYPSRAATEGIANYHAAVAFNSTSDANCELPVDDDYNLVNRIQPLKNEDSPSCEGLGAPLEEWPAANYLANKCFGQLEDRATMLDWTRLFWDLDHTWALSTTQIFALWDAADPHSWDTDGGGGANDVQERFEVAADPAHVNVQAQWSAAAGANGVY